MAEDQNIVEHQVHYHRNNSTDHGHHGLTGLTKGTGIRIGQRKGQQPQQHDPQIIRTIGKGNGQILGITVALKIEADQRLSRCQECARAQQHQGNCRQELKTESMANALMIPGTVELGCKDTRTGNGAEYTQIEHKQQLIDNGNTAHLQGAYLANHDIIQQRNKVCNAVLNDNGHSNAHDPAIKRLVADVSS